MSRQKHHHYYWPYPGCLSCLADLSWIVIAVAVIVSGCLPCLLMVMGCDMVLMNMVAISKIIMDKEIFNNMILIGINFGTLNNFLNLKYF